MTPLDAFTKKTDAPVGRMSDWIGVLSAAYVVVAAAMGWIASTIDVVSQHGWGAVLLVAVLAASCVVAAMGLALIGYRRFRPLPISVGIVGEELAKASELASLREQFSVFEEKVGASFRSVAESSSVQWKNDSRRAQEYSELVGRLDLIEKALKPSPISLLDMLGAASREPFKNKFDEIAAKAASDIDLVRGEIGEIKEQFLQIEGRMESNRKQAAIQSTMLSTSLRARDALRLLKEADEIVMRIGGTLISAQDYASDDAWTEDYERWKKALEKIDKLGSAWSEHYTPLLDIHRRHYEVGGPKTPSNIIGQSDTNAMRYKTVCIAQQRYSTSRSDIMEFFEGKTNEIP